jgi:hypothetical protein
MRRLRAVSLLVSVHEKNVCTSHYVKRDAEKISKYNERQELPEKSDNERQIAMTVSDTDPLLRDKGTVVR